MSTAQKVHTTYKAAGVDIDAGNQVVENIQDVVAQTARPGAKPTVKGFGGFFDLAQTKYKDPILVSGADGVGTKLKIAQALNKHETIGIDLVATCTNDLLVHAAEPLYFLDYFATGKLEPQTATNVVKGIAEGCKQSGCALIGGETAELPSMYADGVYDLGGFAVGAVERTEILPKKQEVNEGDLVIGLPSSGIHSNGFSLVRFLLEKHHLTYNDPVPFDSPHKIIGELLLEPTKHYAKELLPMLKKHAVKGIAHITGGGLLENIPRVLPEHLGLTLDASAWNIQPVFSWLQQMGNIEKYEMFRTFNCGIGMVLIVAPDDEISILRDVKNAHTIGKVTKNNQNRVTISNAPWK